MATPTPLIPPRVTSRVQATTRTVEVQDPALPACIIGTLKEIVEAQVDGSANPSAKVSISASMTGTDTDATKDVAETSFVVEVDGDASQEVEFPISPSGGELSVKLVTNLLDAGITGASMTRDDANKLSLISATSGDGSSLKLKRGKVRVTHGTVTNGPFAVGDIVEVQGTSNTLGTVTKVGAGYVVIDQSTGTTLVTASQTFEKNSGGSPATATVTAVVSAYSALGLTTYFEKLVEGASTYRNRAHRIKLSSLPTVAAPDASGLEFDTDTMNLFRLYGGRLYRLERDAAAVRSRSHQATSTLRKGRAVYPSGSAETATTVTYTTVGALNGSEISVAHRRTIQITYNTLVGTFVVGRTLRNTTSTRIIGVILADTGTILTVALYGGTAPANTNIITDGIATAEVNVTVAELATPIVAVEPRLFRVTFSAAVSFTAGGTLTNSTKAGGQYEIGTILHADNTAKKLVVKLSDAGAPVGIADTVTDGSASSALTGTIETLDGAKLVAVYAGSAAVAAALVAEYVNRSATASLLVKAEVGGASPGSGNATVTNAIVTLSPVSLPAVGAPAEVKFTCYPWDDRDGDSKTPYFWARGDIAALTIGSGNSAVTFTAKGGQDLTAPGNYHGVAGNAITVEGVDSPVSAVTVTVTGTAVRVFYKGPQNSNTHLGSDIVAAVNAHSGAAGLVVATTAVGTSSPTGWTATKLYGGRDPLNFQDTPDPAVIQGERTQQNFGYIRVDVSSATSFRAGEVLKLTNSSGAVVGVVREVDTTNDVLWVDPTFHSGTSSAGGNTSITLDAAFAIKAASVYLGWNVTQGGETRAITVYDGSVSLAATVSSAWVVNPGTTAYTISAPADIAVGNTVYGVTSLVTATVGNVVQEGVTAGDTFAVRFNGGLLYEGSFTATTLFSSVVSQMVAVLGTGVSLLDGNVNSPLAVVTIDSAVYDAADRGGLESVVELSGTGIEKVFGLQPGGRTYVGAHEGKAFKSLVGDELWSGSTKLGKITAVDTVAVGSQSFTAARLKIDSDTLSTSSTYSSWWVKAKNIALSDVLAPETVGGHARPTPGVRVDATAQELLVAQAQARRSDGTIESSPSQGFYIDYDAVRTDLSGQLLSIDDASDLADQLAPVTPENPLAWAVHAALLNSGGYRVKAVAVDDVSVAYPEGTVASYERAMDLLSADDAYSIVPLSQDRDALLAVVALAEEQSVPSDDGGDQVERVVWLSHAQPTEEEPVSAGSGTGTLVGVNEIDVDPDTMNVVDALIAAGFEDPESMTWSELKEAGIYLKVTTQVGNFSILSISGQTITVVTDAASFEPDDNDDLFYSTADLDPDDNDMDSSGEIVTIKVRGADLDLSTGTGRDDLITALGTAAQLYNSSRVRFVQPSQVGMSYNASTVLVDGYYAAAMLAGAVSKQRPSTTYANYVVAGALSVVGSNDIFSSKQLNQGAGYGIWWLTQPTKNGAVICRDQPTTDGTSIETREHSIQTALDWFQKLVRAAAARQPGDNITGAYIELQSVALQGAARLAVESGEFGDAQFVDLTQDADLPTKLNANFKVQPLYPCRELAISIQY